MADTRKNKKNILSELESSFGNVTIACKNAGIARATFYKWLNDDDEFKKMVDEVNESAIDYVESSLMRLIKKGNPTAIIFYLKTKGKKRGYVERQEQVMSVNPFIEAMKHVNG